MAQLDGLRVACIATDGFEQAELTEPTKALRDQGARVDIVSLKSGQIQGFQHQTPSQKVDVDRTLDQISTDEYDAVLLPGGALNADQLRMEPKLQQFLRQMDGEDKPFAVICHAPWELVSADLVDGRTLTSYHTIQDDIRNAGGSWVDREVVVDDNWVTSRQPTDIPAFNREMINLFASGASTGAGAQPALAGVKGGEAGYDRGMMQDTGETVDVIEEDIEGVGILDDMDTNP